MPRAPRLCPRCEGRKKRVVANGRCEDHPVPRYGDPWARDTPYQKDPGWEKLRLDTLRRGKYTCNRCGRRATHVDHVLPKSRGGLDVAWNLQSLCADCHARKTAQEGHAALREKRERLNAAL